jgi:hypothetical protein
MPLRKRPATDTIAEFLFNAFGCRVPDKSSVAAVTDGNNQQLTFVARKAPSADYIRLDTSTRSHANERMMIGPAHRCLVNLETTAAT